jgi:hypothetical protein
VLVDGPIIYDSMRNTALFYDDVSRENAVDSDSTPYRKQR